MSRIVLDASALLAILNDEPGGRELGQDLNLLSGAVISTVNLAEAHSRLTRKGIASDDAWETVLAPVREVIPFDAGQAKIAGWLQPQVCDRGLSLGDRACLALGIVLDAPVYTADRAWIGLDVDVQIHAIR